MATLEAHWRDQLMDLALIASAIDDLQFYWRLITIRWRPLGEKLNAQLKKETHSDDIDPELFNSRFARLLGVDVDYPRLMERVEEELAAIDAIHRFLGLELPSCLQSLKQSFPLPPLELLEECVDYLEELISICRSANYPLQSLAALLTQLLSSPRKTWRWIRSHLPFKAKANRISKKKKRRK